MRKWREYLLIKKKLTLRKSNTTESFPEKVQLPNLFDNVQDPENEIITEIQTQKNPLLIKDLQNQTDLIPLIENNDMTHLIETDYLLGKRDIKTQEDYLSDEETIETLLRKEFRLEYLKKYQ